MSIIKQSIDIKGKIEDVYVSNIAADINIIKKYDFINMVMPVFKYSKQAEIFAEEEGLPHDLLWQIEGGTIAITCMEISDALILLDYFDSVNFIPVFINEQDALQYEEIITKKELLVIAIKAFPKENEDEAMVLYTVNFAFDLDDEISDKVKDIAFFIPLLEIDEQSEQLLKTYKLDPQPLFDGYMLPMVFNKEKLQEIMGDFQKMGIDASIIKLLVLFDTEEEALDFIAEQQNDTQI